MSQRPDPSWRPAYVAVGSNLNQPRLKVGDAFERLAALPDTRLELRSRIYLTRPMGPQDQPDFVNAAAGLLTRLGARGLLTPEEMERIATRMHVEASLRGLRSPGRVTEGEITAAILGGDLEAFRRRPAED